MSNEIDEIKEESARDEADYLSFMPGQRLKKAREVRGLTVEQVAKELHLSQRFVIAMEADAYKDLPEPAFVRGYMRRYAQLVKLSPDDIAGKFDQCYAADQETPPVDARPSNPIQLLGSITRPRLRLRRVMYWGSAAFIAVMLLGVLWKGLSSHQKPSPVAEEPAVPAATAPAAPVAAPDAAATAPANTTPAAATPATAPLPVTTTPAPAPAVVPATTLAAPASPVMNVLPSPAAPSAVPAPAARPAPVKPVPLTVVPAAAAATPAAAVAAPVAAAVPAVTPGSSGPDTLVITLGAESWVSVQDAKAPLVGTLKPAGQITLKGQSPFYVNIGNAAAAAVTLNGKAIDLKPHTQGTVASLTVKR